LEAGRSEKREAKWAEWARGLWEAMEAPPRRTTVTLQEASMAEGTGKRALCYNLFKGQFSNIY
jgi:hypothetical protein